MGKGRGGGGGGRGGGGGVSGHELRKDRRKEERKQAKKRTVALVPNFVGHDTMERTNKRKMCLFISGLQRQLEKDEAHLRHANKKPPAKPKRSGLRGAARPAWEIYPELYPEMHVVEPAEPAIDLVAQFTPDCFEHVETRPLVALYYELGYAHLMQHELSSAQRAFKRALELDQSDALEAKHGLLFASNQAKAMELDSGAQEDKGWRAMATKRDVGALYHIAALTKAQEDVARAVEACPEIALALEQHLVFAKMLDVDQVVAWVRDKRTKLVKTAVETGVSVDLPLGRFEAGLCETDSPQALAVCYFSLYSHVWVKEPKLMQWLGEVLKEMEVVDEDGGGDEEEEEDQAAAAARDDDEDDEEEEEEQPAEVSLTEMFEEALAKCSKTTTAL